MKAKKWNRLFISLLFLVVIVFCGVLVLNGTDINWEPQEPDTSDVIDEPDKYDYAALKKIWTDSHAINSDYKGQIIFQSGLIDLPFVQGQTNNTYLRTDWSTGDYDEEGSIFMDADNAFRDQNLVIYGHFVYPSLDPERTHKFSPLEKLLKKENYEENKDLILVLENEIREYEIVLVFYCELLPDDSGEYIYTRGDLQYYWFNRGEDYFDSNTRSINLDYFNDYIEAARNAALYDIDAEFDFNDRFLTLQTCVENHDELREIILCREVNVIPFKSE
ncbi:MAG: class B sortase [Erysipelotrichaceae bacterium]|nr:class B sortase [Erysipelotrichaceae bacterium]